MTTAMESVFTDALKLPDHERLELVEALIDSLEPEDRPALDEGWKEVVRRRSEELRSGRVAPIPWEEVKRLAREKIGG
jgi:putative addiction module component (TIGR02574 family)